MSKVRAGAALRFSAREWNHLVAAADHSRTALSQFTSRTPDQSDSPQTRVRIKNTSGAARNRYEVLALGDVWRTPTTDVDQFKRELVFVADTPAAATDTFVILLEPIPEDGFGWAVLDGAVQVQVDVERAADKFADVEASEVEHLVSRPDGRARIIYKPSGTGVKWCVVLLSDNPASHAPTYFRHVSYGGITHLSPGGSAYFEHVVRNGGDTDWVASSPQWQVLLYDPGHFTFALPNEVIRAVWSPERLRWETAHESGLLRQVKPASTIANNATGTCNVYVGETITSPLVTLANVRVDWMFGSSSAPSTKEALARYFRGEKEWKLINREC